MDNERNRRDDKRPGFNVGSASIIMVFAVLCLTIFSVLSLITANSDLRLSMRAAKSIEDFYLAEYLAETKVIDIKEKLAGGSTPQSLVSSVDGIKIEKQGNKDVISFVQTVDDKRDIHIALICETDMRLTVSEWRLLPNDNWNPDSGVEVWSGN